LWFVAVQGRKFKPQIEAAAKRYNVDPLLVKAVIWRETRFHPDRRGRAGEIGLMQIQEAAALDWAGAEHVQNFSHEQCFDPGTNVLAGTFYLGKLMKRYARTDNAIPFALADYNAGRGRLLKWNGGAGATNSEVFIGQIGFPNTKAYVKSIMRRYAFYKFLARLEHFHQICSDAQRVDGQRSFWSLASFRLSHRVFKPAPSPKPRQKPKILAAHRYIFSVNALG
jgi:soluble lytic murein transglycosylase